MLPSRKTRLIIAGASGPGRQIDNLDIEADVHRHEESTPDRLQVTVYNLSKETRGIAQKRDSTCQLMAGYDNLSLIFAGRIIFSSTEQDGPDIMTRLDVADGYDAWSSKTVSLDCTPGTTKLEVLRRMAKLSGLDMGPLPPLQGAYGNGYSFHGFWRDGMRDCLGGGKWAIHDNIITFSDSKVSRRHIISADTGMVGSPRQTMEKGKDGKEFVQVVVSCILTTSIKVGDTVDIRGKFASGIVKVTELRHSLGSDWTTTITGRWTT